MDWDDFERKAGGATPQQPLKARRCWVGVLLDDKDPQQPLSELDFIWMIGHSKITLDKVYSTYENVRGLADCLLLTGRDGVVQRHNTLKDVMEEGSELIVFRAVRAAQSCPAAESPAARHINRSPLHEVDSNNADSPVGIRTAHIKDKIQKGDTLRHRVPSNGYKDAQISPRPSRASNDAESPTTRSNPPHSTTHGRGQLTGVSSDPHMHHGQSPLSRTPHTSATPIGHVRTNTFSGAQFQSSNKAAKGSPSSSPHAPSYRTPTVGSSRTSSRTPDVNAQHSNDASTPVVKSEWREHRESPVFHTEIEEVPPRPFDADGFFNREPSQESTGNGEDKPTDESLRGIIGQESPEVLEQGVKQSLQVLNALKQSFLAYSVTVPDTNAWTEAIDKLLPQAKRKRTVIGVVGNTGAGKSSVINALLDEERLVPTNCMRACTAVVTEMSWNDSTKPSSKYRAEIEFITRADWEKEVAMLMKEFLTENGTLQREASDQSTDAGIAWAKFHAVHPKIARDQLGDCTVARLMSDRALNVLGTTKKIDSPSPQRFYRELQKYVDSKEKVTRKDNKEKCDKSAFDLEYWPLIKVVRIYTKASALSTGAVIVDLPGVHDANVARAAVAQGYIQQCTGLWIVAPITRAVDDKAAKTLLGDSFKRQLKFDGGFSNVTFICSKTDDISITEAIDTLDLNDQARTLDQRQDELEQEIKAYRKKTEDLKKSQQIFQQTARDAGDEIEVWEELKDRYDDGKKVYAPVAKIGKRKKNTSAAKPRKKRQMDPEDSDADFIVTDGEESEAPETDDEDEVRALPKPLTEEDIDAKLKELKEIRRAARREAAEIRPQIEELRPRVGEAQTQIKAIKAEISKICISGRNEYSREAIQNDYAAGIKELDQEDAAEEDEDNFNPDQEQRDYDQVARSLPVFCVSSRAYQKMCGRLQKDDAVPGFNTPEETEVPQLQAHCKKLTEAGRVQSCRNFLLSVCQLLTAITLWASSDGAGLKMTDDDKRRQVSHINRRLTELEQGLEACVKACVYTMKSELKDQIFDKYPDLVQEAVAGAPTTAAGWGAHRSEGGLVWVTYKAVVRRNGAFTSGSAGHRDFNLALVEPIIKKLATGWERAFQTRLPKTFSTFIADSTKLLLKFHDAIEARAQENRVGLANLSTLKTQLYTYEMLFADHNQLLVHRMTELQREANRDFVPSILNSMQPAYEVCTDERGPGSFKRMKGAMGEHVERERHRMFDNATMTVKKHLDMMCRSLQEIMEQVADEIWVKMKADYMRALGGIDVNQGAPISREEGKLRAEIMDQLRAVESQFEPILKGESSLLDDKANDGAEDSAANEDDSDAFESAPESVHRNEAAAKEDLKMRDDDGISVAEPPAADKQSRLPTPQSNGVPDAEV